MKYNVSAAHVLDVAEDLDGGPDIIPALDLGWEDDIDHLESGEEECKNKQVKKVDKDNVEEPSHHILMRVEDIEYQHGHSHHEIHRETNKVADWVSPSHVSVNSLESFIDFLGSNTCNHLPQTKRHPKDTSNWDSDYPD